MTHSLRRIQEQETIVPGKGRQPMVLWHRLLGPIAVGTGLLAIVARLLDVAPVPYGLGIAVMGTGVLFLLRRDPIIEKVANPVLSERAVVWFFVLNLVITNVVLALSFHSEKRPTFVFFLIAAQAGSIAVQVLLAPCSLASTRFLLRSQIILLSLGVILGRLLVFPELGIDLWSQEFFAHNIVATGHFPMTDFGYKGYPFWPALAGVVAKLSGCTEQNALLIITVAFSSVALWILLVGLHSLGNRESLLVGLILSVSSWFVYWSSLAFPMIVTVALFGAVLVLLIERRNELQLPMTACLLILLVAGAFFHPYANIASGLLLVTAALVLWSFKRLGAGSRQVSLSAYAGWAAIGALFAVLAMLSVWMYIGDTFKMFVSTIFSSVKEIEPLSFDVGYRSPLVYELDYLGFYLLLLLAAVRFLRWLVDPAESVFRITVLSGALVFLGLNYTSIVTGAFFALPHRWLVYASVLLAIPAAEELRSVARARAPGVFLSALIVMALAFTAVTNTGVDDDNPIYGAEVTFKQNLMASEAAAVRYLDERQTISTTVDWQVWSYFDVLEELGMRPVGTADRFWVYYDIEGHSICPDRPSTLRALALVRRVYLGRRTSGSGCMVESSGLLELDQARQFSKVYDSGGASFYQRVLEDAALSGSQE